MQQAYTGGHYLERSTPILDLCHGVSQNGLFLDYLFAGNRLLELAWVIRSMKRGEKNSGPINSVFISKLRKFHLSFAIFQYSNPSFPYISHHPLQIFHTFPKYF